MIDAFILKSGLLTLSNGRAPDVKRGKGSSRLWLWAKKQYDHSGPESVVLCLFTHAADTAACCDSDGFSCFRESGAWTKPVFSHVGWQHVNNSPFGWIAMKFVPDIYVPRHWECVSMLTVTHWWNCVEMRLKVQRVQCRALWSCEL